MTQRGDGVPLCLYTPVSRGGAAWFVAALVSALADSGGHVEFIAPPVEPIDRDPSGSTIARRFLSAGGGGAGNRAIRAVRSFTRIASSFLWLARARARNREYVVTFYDWLPVQIAQFVWIKALGGRLTHIVHDVTPHAWRFPRPLIWLEKRMQRWSYTLPDRVVVLTDAARRDLADNWGRTDRVWVIPHGAFAEGTPPELPAADRLLLFGMLRRNKNIALSIDAVAMLKGEGVHLTVAGARHVEDWTYWDECAARLPQAGNAVTTEIGFVAEDRLQQLLAQSAAVLLPYEDFASASGVAILAAFAERLLITTDAGGMGELMEHGLQAVRIARPVTADSIAEAIRTFVATPQEQRQAMVRESRAALGEYLSWDRIARVYLDLLER